jgi:hypothetical protein
VIVALLLDILDCGRGSPLASGEALTAPVGADLDGSSKAFLSLLGRRTICNEAAQNG